MREALMMGTAVVPDPHVLKVVNLVGLTFGVLGSLFFAYGLLGKAPDSPLRTLIRHGIPGTLGALIAIPLSAFYTVGSVAFYNAVLPGVIITPSFLQFDTYGWVIAPAAYGLFLGIMTSQLAASPVLTRWKTPTGARSFSWQRFRWAVLLGAVYQVTSTAVTLAVYWKQFAGSFRADLVETLVTLLLDMVPFVLIVGITAGLWERLMTVRRQAAVPGRVAVTATGSGGEAAEPQAAGHKVVRESATTLTALKPVLPTIDFPLSSARGALVGANLAFAIGFLPGLVGGIAGLVMSVENTLSVHARLTDLPFGALALANVGGPVLSGLADAATGAVIGAVFPPALRFANRAQQHDMEIIGLIFLLAGFVVQAVDPLVGLFTP